MFNTWPHLSAKWGRNDPTISYCRAHFHSNIKYCSNEKKLIYEIKQPLKNSLNAVFNCNLSQVLLSTLMSTNLNVLMHYSVAYVVVTAFDKIGATRMWTSMNRIMSLHPDIDPTKLPVGKVICIPDAQPFQNDFAKYKIKRGDTLSFDWAKSTQI